RRERQALGTGRYGGGFGGMGKESGSEIKLTHYPTPAGFDRRAEIVQPFQLPCSPWRMAPGRTA
ncbi:MULTISPECIES: hypothetical protein, partial [Roseomonadaceae]|uniref:hypothetical protein n=1 Tax=Roseomonadaceae TaxID=3385906 RepID=UPI001C240B89